MFDGFPEDETLISITLTSLWSFFNFLAMLTTNLCSVLSLPRTKSVQRPKKKEEYDEDDPEAYKDLPVPDKV